MLKRTTTKFEFVGEKERQSLRFHSFYVAVFCATASMSKLIFCTYHSGVFGAWSLWGLCSTSCFGGSQTRIRVQECTGEQEVRIRASSMGYDLAGEVFRQTNRVFFLPTVTKPGVWSTRQLGEILRVVYVQSNLRRRSTIPCTSSPVP